MGPGIPVRQRSNTRNHVGPGCGAGGRWRGLAAVPVGGGRAWPGFETTRRAKLAARTASGRAAAHRHAKQPGPQLGVTVPGMPAVLQATLWAGRRPPARQAARHAKQLGTPSSPARQAARPPQQGATVPGAPVEPHTTAGNQPEYAASSVARWTPPRPASWAAWVRHEKPSARYTASGCASSVGSSECDATATDKS